ncbi:OmpP1/FadL family transporter [Legionella quateirensis]|uniref:Outer membrane protein n=1 Tax=Legionella quateirensis TaxID=45072 RepID=A0A378KYL5_9GAMM|nr:outer membrane protein transport protein [Legionella quateirensis]KTD47544.1 outer membrane protein [Legionella quateirensis]STY18701.1 outer membrane protein [Legionella quateirensis]
MRKLSTGVLCILAFSAHANVIQYFAGISYNNPSELFKVKKESFIVGGTGFYGDLTFKGSALNFNTFQYDTGVGHSRTYTLLPYGRIAKRFNDKTVFALDVTEPFNSNLDWGNDTFTKYAVTQNYLTDVDVSPKMSYAFNQNLQFGGGLNFNFLLNNEINWAFPTGQFTYSNLVNKTHSFGLGYNLGATYIINQTNFLGLTYYSRIVQKTTGYSVLGSNYSNNLSLSFNMPATTIASYVHIFNPTWLVNLQVFQSEWNVNQYARIFNTAAPPPFSNFVFDMHFGKSYAYLAAVRNQFSEKLGITLAGMIDDGPEHDSLRTIVFPSDTQYFLGLIGDYHVNTNTTVELIYGHVLSYPSIQNRVMANNASIPFTTGFVNIHANIVDLKLKIEA